jgi:lysocardiolipin and lysophospholipid acyltransferase
MGNHQSFSDSFLIYSIGWAVGEVAHIRAFAKKSLSYQPVVGWCWAFLNFIFLSRSFEKDKPNIQRQMRKLASRAQRSYSTGNYWLTIFPEGTRCRPDKLKDAQDFSRARGLPIFQNTLVPRTKGLLATMGDDCAVLRETADAVLDLTIGYPDRRSGGLKVRPSITNLLFGLGRQWKVHVHVRVIPMKEVPVDSDKFAQWLMAVFVEKDQLLEHYKAHGSFPGETHDLPTATWVTLLVNMLVFVALALILSSLGFAGVAAARAYAGY